MRIGANAHNNRRCNEKFQPVRHHNMCVEASFAHQTTSLQDVWCKNPTNTVHTCISSSSTLRGRPPSHCNLSEISASVMRPEDSASRRTAEWSELSSRGTDTTMVVFPISRTLGRRTVDSKRDESRSLNVLVPPCHPPQNHSTCTTPPIVTGSCQLTIEGLSTLSHSRVIMTQD